MASNQHQKQLAVTAYPILAIIYLTLYIFYGSFNNDEFQHLHVIYSITQGLVQYKDIFDNHTPLFQHIMAVIFNLLHVKPGVYIPNYTRLIVFFLFFVPQLIILGYYLKRAFNYSFESIIFILTVLSIIVPKPDIAIRPATLYTLLLLVCLYMVSFMNLSDKKTIFLLGLVNGTNAMVSLKTVLLFVPVELVTLLLIYKLYNQRMKPAVFLVSFLFGFIVVPILTILYFWHLHALKQMYYFTVTYNILPAAKKYHAIKRFTYFSIILAPYIYIILKFKSKIKRPTFTLLSFTFLLSAFVSIYFIREPQTLMPARLLAFFSILVGFVYLTEKSHKLKERATIINTAIFVIVLLFKFFHPPLLDFNKDYKASLSEILSLANKNDYIMDAKGETIFFKRPYFYCLETFTVTRLRLGMLKDTIISDLIKHKTHIVYAKYVVRKVLPKDNEFLRKNYLPTKAKWVWVVGKPIKQNFTVNIPGNYVVLNKSLKPEKGVLDGKEYSGGKIYLKAGKHTFEGQGIIFWYRAYKKGILPHGF